MTTLLYDIIIFYPDKSPVKYRRINNLIKVENYLNKNSNALYFNVYDKINKTYIKRVYIKRGS
jgi:hypothetical protein